MEKKQTFQVEKVIEKIQPLLDARDKRQAEFNNLRVHTATIQKSIDRPDCKIPELQAKIDELLKSNEPTDKLDKELAKLTSQQDTAMQRLNRLTTELLPAADKAVSAANDKLKTMTLAELQPFISGCANLMSRRFAEGCDYYDEFNEALESFCTEHKIDLLAGTMDTAPRAQEGRLYQLLENGVIRK